MRSDAWLSNLDDRLRRQLTFLVEVDRLKTVLRDTPIADGSRLENSAEHSWHLALFAMTLAEYADEPIDVNRVVRMLTIHDIVEIDAGDLSVFRQTSAATQKDAEGDAARRLFGLLPEEMAAEWIALWQEFDAAETADAKFAAGHRLGAATGPEPRRRGWFVDRPRHRRGDPALGQVRTR